MVKGVVRYFELQASHIIFLFLLFRYPSLPVRLVNQHQSC